MRALDRAEAVCAYRRDLTNQDPRSQILGMVQLCEMDCAWAREIGGLRRTESRRLHIYNDSPTTLEHDVEGAGGELAYCRWRGIEWPASVNTFAMADCGRATQVRTTKYLNGSLWMGKDDNPDHYWVLVVGRMPTYYVRGWLKGHDIRRIGWWGSKNPKRKPCWWVTQDQLNKDFGL